MKERSKKEEYQNDEKWNEERNEEKEDSIAEHKEKKYVRGELRRWK